MNSFIKKIVWPIMAIPALFLAIVWRKLPETVAVHFDLKGNPDRYGGKSELLYTTMILVVMNVLVYLILTNIYRIDPKKYAAENKDRLVKIAFAVAIFMSGILCMIIYSAWNGNISFSTGIIFSGTGLLFAVIGNYLPNLKPNYFAGLRLPWTLENEDNWRKTHKLAGKLWFAGGLLLAVICLFLPPVAAIVVFFTIMMIITIIPCIYSYRLYTEQKKLSK
ncbi:MAG TPA: SdpI family protein [Chitinophagaceae bacterium]|nr:SdpI family protein [Chitinophagaceae bacterium]